MTADTMTPRLRKLALAAHIAFSAGLPGSIVAFLALAVAGLISQDPRVIRAIYPAMDLTARFVVVPLALASLLTGLIQSLGTRWGVFRHYWVVAKLLLTAFATTILLVKMELVRYAAGLAAETILPSAELRAAGAELAVHAAGGLLVLLMPVALSVYKPWGLTPYGRRKALPRPPLDPSSTTGARLRGGSITITLRRAHLFGIVVVVLALHLAILHVAGHGRGGH